MTAPARIAPAPDPSLPVLDWLPVTALAVDHAYQRHLGEAGRSAARIRRMAQGWDWSRCGALVVAQTADGHAAIDGQHRLAAATAAGIEALPCLILPAPEVADQARAFVGINRDRAALSPAQRYMAELAAGEAEVVALQAVLDAAGVTVEPREGYALAPGKTRAVARLKRLMKKPGAGYLEDALIMLVQGQPGIEGAGASGGNQFQGLLTGDTVEAATLAVQRVRDAGADMKRLDDVLAETDFEHLTDAARRVAAQLGRKTARVMAAEIIRSFNKGRREGARLTEEF